MKDTIKQLRGNMEKLLVVSDMYDELLGKRVNSGSEAEEAMIRYNYLKNKVLQLTAESRRLVRTTEIKDKP